MRTRERESRGKADLSRNERRIERKNAAGFVNTGAMIQRGGVPLSSHSGGKKTRRAREGATIARQLLSTHSAHISCFAEAAKM